MIYGKCDEKEMSDPVAMFQLKELKHTQEKYVDLCRGLLAVFKPKDGENAIVIPEGIVYLAKDAKHEQDARFVPWSEFTK